MPIVNPCSHPGCSTLSIGELCVEHEPAPAVALLRGRPFPEYSDWPEHNAPASTRPVLGTLARGTLA
jgi:hypothetical protein